MNIKFSDQFRQFIQPKFQIRRDQVRRAIQKPLETEIIQFDGQEIRYYTSKESRNGESTYLLIATRIANSDLMIDQAFRIPADLIVNLKTTNPMILLAEIIERFGLNIHIGEKSGKYFHNEEIPLDQIPLQPMDLIKIDNPP